MLLNSQLEARERLYGKGQAPALTYDIFNAKHEAPWAASLQALNASLEASGQFPCLTLTHEALRLEQLAGTASAHFGQGNIRDALEVIEHWELSELPTVQSILNQVHHHQSISEVAALLAPLRIITTLYLWACWSLDFGMADGHDRRLSITPELRGQRLVRPMTLWLEQVKAQLGIRTNNDLADRLLASRSPEDDVETHRRLFRKWWQKGELAPWSRVPHIISSLCEFYGEEKRGQIEFSIYVTLAQVRLMDRLLSLSERQQKELLPLYDYNALSPFNDFTKLREFALGRKESLSPKNKR